MKHISSKIQQENSSRYGSGWIRGLSFGVLFGVLLPGEQYENLLLLSFWVLQGFGLLLDWQMRKHSREGYELVEELQRAEKEVLVGIRKKPSEDLLN